MIQEMQLGPNLLLHIGMDGPTVNKKFHSIIEQKLSVQYKTVILNIGTCTLHQVHSAFRAGLKLVDFDVDKFFTDVSFFFKLSAAGREDYSLMERFIDLEAQIALRHVTSWWLSLRKAALRILEQYPNLKQYFLVYLPLQKNFKREVFPTDGYKRIVKILNDPLSQIYIAFLAFASTNFKEYMLSQQTTTEPMIHLMHDRMVQLIFCVTRKFMIAVYCLLQCYVVEHCVKLFKLLFYCFVLVAYVVFVTFCFNVNI